MKGKNKLIIPLLLAGMATTSVVSNVNTQQVALATTTDTEIKNVITNVDGIQLGLIGGFEDTYSYGTPITMPKVTTGTLGTTGKVVYEIINGDKTVKSFTVTKEDMEDANYNTALTYTPTYTGRYLVKITASENGRVSSVINNLSFNVVRSAASIVLPTNSRYVIPETVAVKQQNLKVPFPKVTVEEDGEDVEKSVADLDGRFTVKLITPNGIKTDSFTKNTTDNTFDINADHLDVAGTYKILFEYRSSTGSDSVRLAYLEKTFQVSNNYKAPTSLVVKLSGNPADSGVVGTEISIPKATVYAEDKTTKVNAHIRIWYTHLESGDKKELTAEEVENYTFKPTKIGSYTFSYQADMSTLYAGLVSELNNPTKIMKVYDTQAPTIVITDSYEVDANGNIVSFNNKENVVTDMDEELEGLDLYAEIGKQMNDRSCDVTSIAVRKNGKSYITVPAVYAYDNNDGYSNLTLKREIVGSGITRIVVEDLINPDTQEKYKPNETAVVEFTSAANTYTVRYTAEDKAVNKDDTSKTKPNTSTKTPSVVVKDVDEEGVADELKKGKTTITLKINKSSISKNDTFTFEAPTVKDTFDSNCDVKVGYILYSDAEGKTAINAEPTFIKKNDDGKYELDMTKVLVGFSSAKTLRVVVYATADSSLEGYRTFDFGTTTVEKSKVITISDTSNDELTPTLVNIDTASEWNSALFAANKDILTNNTIKGIDEDGIALVQDPEGEEDDYIRYKNVKGTELAAFDQCTTNLNLTSQKNILKLPNFTIVDDNKLTLSVTVQDEDGNIIPLQTQMSHDSSVPDATVLKQNNKYQYTIQGVSFMLSSAGVYTVTYKATDVLGNTLVKTFGVRVNDKTPPSIVVEDQEKFGTDIQVGEFFEIPYRYLIKNNIVDVDEPVYWQLYDQPDNIEIQPEVTEDGFTAYAPGTYYIRFYGYDEYMNLQMLQEDTKFFVNVVDTTKPVFNQDSEYILPAHVAWEEDTKTKDIEIPLLRASDNDITCSPKVRITVTGPNGSTVTVKEYTPEADEELDTMYFTVSKQGIYTIKYEATDKAGNTIERTEEVKVGDYTAPTIEWKNESLNINKTVKLNDYLKFDVGNLNIADTECDYEDLDIEYKVVKQDGSSTIKNEGNEEVHKYHLTETGSYKLVITVTDAAGNKATKETVITVPSETVDKDEVSPVVGTVLVVVAVAILAGVVVYFVVSNKKKSGNAKRPSKKSKK